MQWPAAPFRAVFGNTTVRFERLEDGDAGTVVDDRVSVHRDITYHDRSESCTAENRILFANRDSSHVDDKKDVRAARLPVERPR